MTSPSGVRAAGRITSLFGLAAILIAFTLDQVTKQMALATLSRGNVEPVLSFFDLRLSFNEGVSFGMLAQTFAGRPLALAGIIVAVIALLTFLLLRSQTWFDAIALGAIIGGALGNVLDRLRTGAVVDFLDFHLWGYHWPAFNLADTAIVIGVAILILSSTMFGSAHDARKRNFPK